MSEDEDESEDNTVTNGEIKLERQDSRTGSIRRQNSRKLSSDVSHVTNCSVFNDAKSAVLLVTS